MWAAHSLRGLPLGRSTQGKNGTFLSRFNLLDLTSWVPNCPAIFAACYHSVFLSCLSCLSSVEKKGKGIESPHRQLREEELSQGANIFNGGFVTSEPTLEPKGWCKLQAVASGYWGSTGRRQTQNNTSFLRAAREEKHQNTNRLPSLQNSRGRAGQASWSERAEAGWSLSPFQSWLRDREPGGSCGRALLRAAEGRSCFSNDRE